MDAADMSATCCSLALASMSEKDGGLGLTWRRYHLTNQQASSTSSQGVKYFDRSSRLLSRPRHIALYIVDVPRTRGKFLPVEDQYGVRLTIAWRQTYHHSMAQSLDRAPGWLRQADRQCMRYESFWGIP